MGVGPVAQLARSSDANAMGYILGSSGLDLYRYKLDRQVAALTNPVAYLAEKKDAVDTLINPATITASINAETFAIGQAVGFPGYPVVGAQPNAAQYMPVASPFVKDLAANKVIEKIKQDLAIIDIQFPSSIDEIAKKKPKKRIKGRVEAGDQL